MPDITMCSGLKCKHKDKCYRHIAVEDTHQTYFMTPPLLEDGSCEHYWEASPVRIDANKKALEVLEEIDESID